MPFTISHAAIVTPFTTTNNKYVSATGLIIGSMVPDFFYFILLNPYFSLGHTWWGIFVYDIPLGIVLAFLYHNGVKQALGFYLPKFLGGRLSAFHDFNWNRYFKANSLTVISSLILGVLTHFFLDGFTHEDGYFVLLLPSLQNDTIVLGHTMKAWYLLQYLTSIAGLLVLYWYYMKMPLADAPSATLPVKTRFWATSAITASLILIMNEIFHHIDCKGMDYLAIILGGAFYGLLISVFAFRKHTVTILS